MSGAIPKTERDCAHCPMVSKCDAHVTNGDWHHAEGEHPCRPVITADKMDAMSDKFCASVDELCRKNPGIIDADKENARIVSSGHYHPKAVRP